MKVTRKMVAERAGVTKESVSYVLNRSRPVSAEIVERVERAVAELGYVPDMSARSLNNKRTNTVGVIINDIANPYYSDVIHGIEAAARRHGYIVLLSSADGNLKRNIAEFVARRVDGILFLVFPYKFNDDYSVLTAAGIRYAVTHNCAFADPAVPHLEPDFESGIRDALTRLKEWGHESVVMLSPLNESETFDDRLSAFKTNYRRIFGKEPVYLVADDRTSDIENGKRMARKFLESGIDTTAVLCFNDLMAVGVMQELKDCGVKIPETLSVVGIDNMMFAPFTTPSLATIAYDKAAFGEKLFDMLYDSIYSDTVSSEKFPLYFLPRDSVCKR